MRITLYYGKELIIDANNVTNICSYDGEYHGVDSRVKAYVRMRDDKMYYCSDTYTQLCERRNEELRRTP